MLRIFEKLTAQQPLAAELAPQPQGKARKGLHQVDLLLAQRLQRAVELLQHHQHRPVAAEQTIGHQRFAVVGPVYLNGLRRDVLTGEGLQDPQRPRHLHHIRQQPALLQQARQLRLKLRKAAVALAQVVQSQHTLGWHQGRTVGGLHQRQQHSTFFTLRR